MRAIRIAIAILFLSIASTKFMAAEAFRPLDRSINSQGSEFAPSLNASGSIMVYSAPARGGGPPDIYLVRRKGKRWSRPTSLKELNSRYSDETPFLSPDGNVIFFASDRDGSAALRNARSRQTMVSYDLYISRFRQGQWGRPTRIPGAVNTVAHERSPSFDRKTQTLYYARWPFGRYREVKIMRSRLRAGRFAKPEPLPRIINKGYFETAPRYSERDGGLYFASRRPGGRGGWDIYFSAFVKGRFVSPRHLQNGINGPYHDLYFFKGRMNQYLASNRPGTRGKYDIFERRGQKKPSIHKLIPIRKDGGFELHAVRFDYDSDRIRKESYPYLDALATYMKKHQKLRYRVIGHTDMHGNHAYCDALSLKRAQSVIRYLLGRGLAANRFQARGMGKRQPLRRKPGPKNDQLNRRTEFRPF